MLTLIADRPPETRTAPPHPYEVRPARRSDTERLGALYLVAYDPGVAAAHLDHAVADIRASFAGEYGLLWEEASPVASLDGELVAAVLTVRRAPWPDTPDHPFVIETFTAPDHRRRGLARALLSVTFDAVAGSDDGGCLALRVDPANTAALALYRSLGFRIWEPDHQ